MGKRRVPEDRPADASGDVALVFDRTEDLEGYRVLRHRAAENQVEIGTMRPLQEGRPIDGEVVSLEQRQDLPFLYDVKTELPDPHAEQRRRQRDERRLTSDGPAQVATEEYRRGWDAIWGRSELPTSSDKLN